LPHSSFKTNIQNKQKLRRIEEEISRFLLHEDKQRNAYKKNLI